MSERFERVSIVGVGLIGGSLGLALCAKRLAGRVVGVGHRQTSIDKALKMGAIDEGTLDIVAGTREADLVVLATGVELIVRMGETIAPHLKVGCVVSDVGSTKSMLAKKLEAALGGGVHFVGAHPIAGSEKRGIGAASADLFEGTVCVLTPTSATDRGAMERVAALWREVGADIATLSPEEHDSILARTSHVPHLAAAALIASLEKADEDFVGTGLRDTTRVASGDVGIWCDIAMTNREAVLHALDTVGAKLSELRRAIETGDRDGLAAILAAVKARRDEIWPDTSASA